MGTDIKSLPVDAMKNIVEKMCPLGVAAEAEEMANIASFLASNDAKNMTGSIVASDGGALIKNHMAH